MNPQSRANKFVCPNDRQLSLRAKLRTGWSAAKSEPPLTTAEREAIAAVVKRAEKVDEVESKRVGKLVARLEGMRRSAFGPAARSCLLCGETARLLAPLRTCSICRNTACSKCVIDTPSVCKSPIYSREQYICNLCAETREMWKKSGAWFFKTLPKYVLPEKKTTCRYNDTELARSLQAKKQKRVVKQIINIRCPICFNYLGIDKEISSTICGHVFCTSCLQKALLTKPNCPTCRKDLLKKKCYHPLYLDNDCTNSANDNCDETMA